MSWDILVLNSSNPVDFEKGNWPDFPSRQYVVECISQSFPQSSWNGSSWGVLDTEDASIEFNIGDSDILGNCFMIHVRGGKAPTAAIYTMCAQHRWIAFDISGGEYISATSNEASFIDWKQFRDRIVSSKPKERPW
jgi:hypothetical protein